MVPVSKSDLIVESDCIIEDECDCLSQQVRGHQG